VDPSCRRKRIKNDAPPPTGVGGGRDKLVWRRGEGGGVAEKPYLPNDEKFFEKFPSSFYLY